MSGGLTPCRQLRPSNCVLVVLLCRCSHELYVYLCSHQLYNCVSQLYCCAVEDSSWSVYRSSAWYDAQPGIRNLDRPMVPASCCVRNQYHELLDIERCQTTITGPPYVTGGDNKTLYHRVYHARSFFYVEMI